MRLCTLLVLGVLAGTMVGCGDSGPDANYKAEVKMSEADKQKEQEMMAGQKALGAAPERGGGGPSQLTVPGKGGR